MMNRLSTCLLLKAVGGSVLLSCCVHVVSSSFMIDLTQCRRIVFNLSLSFFISLYEWCRTWRLKDLCYSPSIPSFDIAYIDQVSISSFKDDVIQQQQSNANFIFILLFILDFRKYFPVRHHHATGLLLGGLQAAWTRLSRHYSVSGFCSCWCFSFPAPQNRKKAKIPVSNHFF